MDISKLTRLEKAKVLSTVAHAVQQALGGDNLFIMLIVDKSGGMCDVKNINRDAVPRLLREYAQQVEKKGPLEA